MTSDRQYKSVMTLKDFILLNKKHIPLILYVNVDYEELNAEQMTHVVYEYGHSCYVVPDHVKFPVRQSSWHDDYLDYQVMSFEWGKDGLQDTLLVFIEKVPDERHPLFVKDLLTGALNRVKNTMTKPNLAFNYKVRN